MPEFRESGILDCKLIVGDRHYDDRGFFQELYHEGKYAEQGISQQPGTYCRQLNWSVSKKNALRGIHVAEYSKLVTCVSGRIWDLVVDLRFNSPTFLKHIGVELSPESNIQMYVPEGCGHGFVSLEENSNVVYMQNKAYDPDHKELSVIYSEPNLNIKWPGENHIVSDRDKEALPLWAYQMCCPGKIDYILNDKLEMVWLNSLPEEKRKEWCRKHSIFYRDKKRNE